MIIRHGQSLWNKDNKFTGWIDIDLSAKGREEAMNAGKKLHDMAIDVAFTSELKRAQDTLNIILKETGKEHIPVYQDKALNERQYGDLQGMNKDVAREKFGAEQVHIWRRSWDTPPPNGECLKDTSERVLPYYESEIEPLLKDGKNVLISAHGNSLRALVKHLEGLTPDEILNTEIPTGVVKVYELDEELNILKTYYLE
jgi:2,3-bisphosphoglycerate-dependent phosphoglycerate mutase